MEGERFFRQLPRSGVVSTAYGQAGRSRRALFRARPSGAGLRRARSASDATLQPCGPWSPRSRREHPPDAGRAPSSRPSRTTRARRAGCRAPARAARATLELRAVSARPARPAPGSARRGGAAELLRLARLREPLERVLADRLEHPEAARPEKRTRLLSTSDCSVSRSASQTASAASSVQPPRKTARRANSALLVLGQQLVAPVDRRPQRAAGAGSRPARRRQQVERCSRAARAAAPGRAP